MENELKNSEAHMKHKVDIETGFSTPSNYFDNLEASLFTKISEEKFAKETAFKVPENYFNQLECSILSKAASTKKETNVLSFKELILQIIPFVAAASIVLFIGLNSFVFNAKDTLTLDSLSDSDIEYWLDVTTVSNLDIATILQDDILDQNEFYYTDISDESIEEYLNSLDNTLWNEIN
ncbi:MULTISPECIES: hypothetical protein [unclassified Polaribacter]|uniref:hypothetical protein n=1 Tax=unclassified Polaribacter TaxID=196858 RepID=UPI0011BD5C3F|nr:MULTISPECIES: hypothetical protein [unclassified Polaribacter]TXD52577.1 hypothetical protein ES043_07800 [Polaribacter sp. IC063]TXD56774.1 hypothetical protein ES044_16220 [Polaribacter sp. IC066]